MKWSYFVAAFVFASRITFADTTDPPCFTVALSEWKPAMALGGDEVFLTPPKVIRLTNDVAREMGSSQEFSVVPAMGAAPSVHKLAYWHPEGDDIQIAWSNGFSGFSARLSPTTDGFKGEAHSSWDFDRPSQSSTLRLMKVPCQ